jgi:hypothetical protein
MPLVRINLSKSYSPEQRQIVSDVVYTATTVRPACARRFPT